MGYKKAWVIKLPNTQSKHSGNLKQEHQLDLKEQNNHKTLLVSIGMGPFIKYVSIDRGREGKFSDVF